MIGTKVDAMTGVITTQPGKQRSTRVQRTTFA